MLTATPSATPAVFSVSSKPVANGNRVADEVRSMGIEKVRAAIAERRAKSASERQVQQVKAAIALSEAAALRYVSQ